MLSSGGTRLTLPPALRILSPCEFAWCRAVPAVV